MRLTGEGPLWAALRAVVTTLYQSHTIPEVASIVGVGERTVGIWLAQIGGGSSSGARVRQEDLDLVAEVLGLSGSSDAAQAVPDVPAAVPEPVVVEAVPAKLRRQLERVTELMLLTDYKEATSLMLSINLDPQPQSEGSK